MKGKNPERKMAVDKTASDEKPAKPREPKLEQQEKSIIAKKATQQAAPGSASSAGVKERRFRQTDLPAHFIERRKNPRINTEQPKPPAPPRINDYVAIIGQP